MGSFSGLSCHKRGEYEYNNLDYSGEGRKWYQHDIDQLVYSNAFRKLQKKSQLLSERDPRCRSRLIHTLEVNRIAKEISWQLGLDVELTEAIALGHDFGNTAYGTISNKFLNNKTNGLFLHEEISGLMVSDATQKLIPLGHNYRKSSINLLDKKEIKYGKLKIDKFPFEINISKIENDYFYSCISPEVIDGIVKHGTELCCDTLEGQVVNYSDNIAYLSQDIDDLITSKIMDKDDVDKFEALTENCGISDNQMANNSFNKSRSSRIGVYIKYFVEHNKELLESNRFKEYKDSSILGLDIPVLEIKDELKCIIDTTWTFVETFYSHNLIKTSNKMKESKMECIWNILNDDNFTGENLSYKNYIKSIETPIYYNYKKEKGIDDSMWTNWVNSYFIAHLSCDEIDTILNSYQARDYIFELDI